MFSNLLISMPGMSEIIISLIVIPLMALLLLVILRKPIMWYFGNIDLINESRKQTQLLKEIRDSLKERKDKSV